MKPRSPAPSSILALVTLLLAVGGGGCVAASFSRAWNTQPAPKNASDLLAGKWEGSWVSDVTGHHDSLRCLIRSQPNATNRYEARFHARYRKILHFSFDYTVPLQTEADGTNLRFVGQANLGWLAGGVYQYSGTASGTNFFSVYTSKYDHGTFRMIRPLGSP